MSFVNLKIFLVLMLIAAIMVMKTSYSKKRTLTNKADML
jgi:hypothetical protein